MGEVVVVADLETSRGKITLTVDTACNTSESCCTYKARTDDRYEKSNRRVTAEEYRSVLDHADEVGLERVEYNPGLAKDRGGGLGWP